MSAKIGPESNEVGRNLFQVRRIRAKLSRVPTNLRRIRAGVGPDWRPSKVGLASVRARTMQGRRVTPYGPASVYDLGTPRVHGILQRPADLTLRQPQAATSASPKRARARRRAAPAWRPGGARRAEARRASLGPAVATVIAAMRACPDLPRIHLPCDRVLHVLRASGRVAQARPPNGYHMFP